MRTHHFLVINPRSGRGKPTAAELEHAARDRGIETYLIGEGEDPGESARASGADVVGAAGGDGSLAPVAQAAIELDAAFVCVPFGTRNNFAVDLGLDRRDPFAALAAFTDGRELRIDAGRVAGRLFVNNVSLGAYAGLVHKREHHRRRREALARVRALAGLARHPHRLHACVDGEDFPARVLLIGNNRYAVDLFTLGVRERLDEGVLQLRAAAGLLPTAWSERVSERFRIELPGGRIDAAIDGEPAKLEPPLVVESLPHALRVLLPPR